MKVGFIGLGLMGSLMVARLRQGRFSLKTYDKNGSGSARSPREAVRDADVVITMVPDGKAVLQAVRAALPGLKKNCIVIDMSSSDPAHSLQLSRLLKKNKIHFLDAPVSGAKAKAKDGTLAIMVGGEAKVLKRVQPVLSKLGTQIFHTGGVGSGHATKALNNYLGAAGTIAGFEALLVGEKFGLEPKVLVEVINASTGKNSTTERKIPQQIFTRAFASGFKLSLMTKDVEIARNIARGTRVETPYLDKTLKIWRDALSRRPGGADHTEMYRYLKRLKPRARGAASRRAGSRRRRRRST